ncbi:hypothetical protein LQW54_002977 [Pestalotiopsis sp. IQ-011]
MARKDPNDVKLPAKRRPTPSSIANGPDEDWVHVVPSEPVCRDLSASSCYMALPGVDAEDGDGTVADGEEAEHSVEIDAKEVSPKKTDASHTDEVDDGVDAVASGKEAEHPVEMDAKHSSPKKSDSNHAAEVNDVDHAGGNGVEAEQSVEMDAEKVSLKKNGASTSTEYIIPATRFNLILMQSQSPILYLLSARLADGAEEQKTPDDHDSDVD